MSALVIVLIISGCSQFSSTTDDKAIEKVLVENPSSNEKWELVHDDIADHVAEDFVSTLKNAEKGTGILNYDPQYYKFTITIIYNDKTEEKYITNITDIQQTTAMLIHTDSNEYYLLRQKQIREILSSSQAAQYYGPIIIEPHPN
jgi:hypothetical protein